MYNTDLTFELSGRRSDTISLPLRKVPARSSSAFLGIVLQRHKAPLEGGVWFANIAPPNKKGPLQRCKQRTK